MQAFTFYSPTEIVFGKGTEQNIPSLVKKWGGSRVLVVYGSGSVVKSGLLARITEGLAAAGIEAVEHGGAQPNPVLSHVRTGIALALENQVDFVLAVGGGSAIDTAKAIAIGAANSDADIWQIWLRKEEIKGVLPLGVVLTISAAGSETSDSAVITNEETTQKVGLNCVQNRPCFAVMDPELTFTLPYEQIAYGVTDILMHTLERYFTTVEGNEITDGIAEAVLTTVMRNGLLAMKDRTNYLAMSELMWCGSLSHNHITGLGRPQDFGTHRLGHELSGEFGVAHGASLSAMWGSWARYVWRTNPARFVRLGEKVLGMDLSGMEEEAAVFAAIAGMEDYFRSLGMPTCISELLHQEGGVDDALLQKLAERGSRRGPVGAFVKLYEADMLAVYRAANH